MRIGVLEDRPHSRNHEVFGVSTVILQERKCYGPICLTAVDDPGPPKTSCVSCCPKLYQELEAVHTALAFI